MRKFNIRIFGNLSISYNHYLSIELINEQSDSLRFKGGYPLWYSSRRFDKPAIKRKDGTCIWWLNNKWHRVGKPAWIFPDGDVEYWEDGERVR